MKNSFLSFLLSLILLVLLQFNSLLCSISIFFSFFKWFRHEQQHWAANGKEWRLVIHRCKGCRSASVDEIIAIVVVALVVVGRLTSLAQRGTTLLMFVCYGPASQPASCSSALDTTVAGFLGMLIVYSQHKVNCWRKRKPKRNTNKAKKQEVRKVSHILLCWPHADRWAAKECSLFLSRCSVSCCLWLLDCRLCVRNGLSSANLFCCSRVLLIWVSDLAPECRRLAPTGRLSTARYLKLFWLQSTLDRSWRFSSSLLTRVLFVLYALPQNGARDTELTR